jgi:hypothetical protein
LVRHTFRASFWLLLLALGLLSQPLYAQAPANSVAVKTYTGYYNDTAVYFAAFETNSANFAAVNGIVLAPRLSQVNTSALPRMIFFMNGTGRQTVVMETQPGQTGYNPLWRVLSAWWVSASPMPLITSFAAASQFNQQGMLAVQDTGIIFNGPVFLVNRPLDLSGNGTLAPTISPQDFLGINPSIRTAYFKANQGYYNGQLVTFLGLEHAAGEINDAPGAIPVPTIGTDVLGQNAVANFYDVDGQLPVIDAIPVRQVTVTPGTPGNVYGSPTGGGVGVYQQPYGTDYSPIWHVHQVKFNAGITPRALQSVQEIQQAASLGQVTVIPGGPSNTFNCPVPFYYQSGASPTAVYTSPTTSPTTGGGSGYIAPSPGGTPGTGY